MDKCPKNKKLADAVVANDLSLLQIRDPPGLVETKELYQRLWGIAGPNQKPLAKPEVYTPIEGIFTPISPKEIESKLAKVPNTSAAGPDGITKADLRKRGISVILQQSKLFNAFLMHKHYPTAWRMNRTTLIPKAQSDTSKVKNWRPITISSIISRIYSVLLDKRLRRVIHQSERQKGFTVENGCYSNVQLLNQAISVAKEEGGIVTVVDVSKAFDTVPHAAIKVSLERKGIPPLVADYITHSYKECVTTIKTCNGTINLELKRGVKQGDPLSPLLFNLAIEPILDSIQKQIGGLQIEGHNVAAVAFADDIVLLARNREEAMAQILLVHDNLKSMNMKLSIEKSSAFEYVPRNRSWFIRDPEMRVGGDAVPYNDPETTFRYLGARISPWKGMINGQEIVTIEEVLARIHRLPIKPMQKSSLMRTYILPRYTFGLIIRPPSRGVLNEIDATIRRYTKKILHLHETTSNFFFYTP